MVNFRMSSPPFSGRCCLLVEHCDGPYGRPGTAPDTQREPDECEPLPDQLVEVRQVLVVVDAMLPAHHVARVRTADRVVRAGGVHAERFYAFFDDPVTT